jgi:hypothetical protein
MQEMVSGGRYLSGCESLLVFAARTNQSMMLEVRWRNGKTTLIENVLANQSYEVDESTAQPNPASIVAKPAPLFEDVSARIAHVHKEPIFDDFQRQPLIPRKLSQLGPGVTWFDVDGDQHDDLLVVSGPGQLSHFRNLGNGSSLPRKASHSPPIATLQHFSASAKTNRPFSSPASPTTKTAGQTALQSFSTTSPLTRSPPLSQHSPRASARSHWLITMVTAISTCSSAAVSFLADILSPHLPFFIEPERSLVSRSNKQCPSEQSRSRQRSSLERPGSRRIPELILACEWGPIRLFKNDAGALQEATAKFGLEAFAGLWNGVTTADLDGDGSRTSLLPTGG